MDTQSPTAEIVRYIKLVIEKRFLFVVSSLVIMSIIVWGSYFLPKQYEAKSTILIDRNVIEDLVKGIAISPSMESRIGVLKDTMLSRTLVLKVLRKLDLDSKAEDEADLQRMIIEFRKKTDLSVKKNNLINVSFINKNPVLSRDYVNSLVDVYVENNVFDKKEEAYDATIFLEKQVAFFKKKMDRGEDAIINFRQEQGIYAAMDDGALIDEIKKYELEIENMNIKVKELTAAKESIKRQLKDEEPYTVTMFTKKGLEETLNSLENQLNQLLISYTENYPEIIQIKAEIEALKIQENSQSVEDSATGTESEISAVNPMYQELKQRVIEIEAEIDALSAREKYVTTLIEKKKQELRNVPENQKKLGDLTKERDSFKGVYLSLLQRLGQSEVSKQMEIEDKATTFRIIEPAIVPTLPVSPNRKLIIIAGIVIGFLGGFALLFMMDYLDDSVKNVDSLKSFGMPVLAVIPRIQTKEDVDKQKKKDLFLYGISGMYMLCILTVLALEVLGLPYIENFVDNAILNSIRGMIG